MEKNYIFPNPVAIVIFQQQPASDQLQQLLRRRRQQQRLLPELQGLCRHQGEEEPERLLLTVDSPLGRLMIEYWMSMKSCPFYYKNSL